MNDKSFSDASRAEQFLGLFNEIEQEFRSRLLTDEHKSFFEVVDTLSDRDQAVRHYARKLKMYAGLRNVIVHGNKTNGQVVAEPNEFALDEFTRIKEKVLAPKKVFPDLLNHRPEKIDADDLISAALMIFKEKKYSQILVYRNNAYIGMLRTMTIASWLANYPETDLINLHNFKVQEILSFDDKERNEIFRSVEVNIFEVLEIFQKNEVSNVKVDSIIITDNGRSSGNPRTIITEWDLPKILKNV